MKAGYISARVYSALYPMRFFSELSYDDCLGYSKFLREELVQIFKDEEIIRAIADLEQIEDELLKGSKRPIEVLKSCLINQDPEVVDIIKTIGEDSFILDYVYCNEKILIDRDFITPNNLNKILEVIHKFRGMYPKYYLCGVDTINSQKEEKGGFINTDQSVIEYKESDVSGKSMIASSEVTTDATSLEYIYFLQSLNEAELVYVIEHLEKLLQQTSIRTQKCIKLVGYRNFLINYLFSNHYKLLRIRNFGKKSMHELDLVRPAIIEFISNLYEGSDKKNESITKIEQEIAEQTKSLRERIGEIKYKLLAKKLEELVSDASVRTKNGILNYDGDFIEDFVSKGKKIRCIRNIGAKSEIEIKKIIETLKETLSLINERVITEEDLIIFNKQTFYKYCFDDYASNFLQENKHLPMFHLLERSIKHDIEYNRELQIFNLHTPFFEDEDYYSLEEIAKKFSLTRESIRQKYMHIRKLIQGDIKKETTKKGICYEKFFKDNSDWNYVRENICDRSYVDISITQEISSMEQNNFADNFVFYVISCICSDIFTLVGKDPLYESPKKKQIWNNCYLIKKEIADKFDFNALFELVEEIETSSSEDIVASAQDLLLNVFITAWKEFDSNLVEELSGIISTILIKDLGIIPDENLLFTIEGKKEEDIANVLYDILLANGNPLTLEELFVAIDSKFPNKFKSSASIRIYVMKDPRLCHVGVNNLVGLLEWNHIKIGSIRDIIIQYLDEFNEPQHVSKIYRFVQRYRDTTERSIRSTMSSGDQFIPFGGGLYGLKDKHYSKVFYHDDNESSFEQRIRELESFLQTQKHFPFMPSDTQEESLYRWWKKNKNATKLKTHQKSEIDRIKSFYKDFPSNKRDFVWFDLCRKYQDFVRDNNRRPSRHNKFEQKLCSWFEKTTNDFIERKLSAKQELAFLELSKSL